MQPARPAKPSWVVSSFDSIAVVNDETKQVSRKRFRSEDLPPITKRTCKLQSDSTVKPLTETRLWVDKYAPTTQEQLAVHKKKIEEVKSFLQQCFDSKYPNQIVLLTGPAGAGKSATIRVLANDLNFQIVEWLNKSGLSNLYGNNIYDEKQSTTFREFLLKSNRYSSNQLFDGQWTRKIILIEEFPTAFFKDKTEFHDAIRKYRKMGTCPLVFIITDNTKNDSNESTLLPAAFKTEVQITGISFNPVAQTSMVKALTRVAMSEGVDLPATTIDHLTDSTSGDIRAAINALQFRFHKDAKIMPAQSKGSEKTTKKSRAKKSTAKTDVAKVSSPFAATDHSLYLFHALGKILHCKRNYGDNISNSLPRALRSKERCPLLIDPEDTWERTSLSAERFVEFLHENYMSFFDDLKDQTEACEYLSFADALASDWQDKSSLEPYVSSIVSRGIMHSNTRKESSGWKPLCKPKLFEVNRTFKQMSDLGKQLFQDKYSHLSKQDLMTDLTPYLLQLQPSCLTAEQINYLRNVTRITFSKPYSTRIKSDNLNEKDIYETNIDAEEATLSQAGQIWKNLNISDINITIEEYDD